MKTGRLCISFFVICCWFIKKQNIHVLFKKLFLYFVQQIYIQFASSLSYSSDISFIAHNILSNYCPSVYVVPSPRSAYHLRFY